MSKFLRGAHIRGNTEVPLVSVPRITGTVRRDSSGEIAALPLPSTLKVESDLGNASVTFTTSRALNDIVAALSAALAALATVEDRDGCLSILSLTSGAGGYIRIKAPSSGFPDAAPYFGFRVDPHPLATVAAGDVERAEVRPSTEANPEGTAFVPYGADRTPRAFNRALMRLSKNLDHLHSRMVNPVAMPIALEVDATDVAWAARLTLDADDNVVQMDLSDLAGINPGFAGRVYVGELDANSSLNAIGACFKILDTDDNEIVAADNRVVRVAAVTRGMRAAAVPLFPDDWNPPAGPLSDTVAVVPDGGNALGVDLVKSAATAISEVLDHATIVVAGATYVTDGVVPGDIVTISGSNIDSPTNHNGTYIVEVVVSEEQLVIRAQDPEAPGDLNLGPGILGDAQVSTGGKFQDNVWLTFDPPIPPQQLRDGVSFKVVVGLEKSLGFVSDVEGLILRLFARSSAEVDGFAMRDIRRQLNFGGAYDGQAPRTATGAGGFGLFTRPASLRGIGDGKPTSGVSIRSEVGGSTSGYYLTAAPGDQFTSDDVGRLFFLTDPTYNGLPCLAVQLDGNQRIMLLRLDDSEDGALPTEPAVDYEVRSGALVEFPALLQARSVTDGVNTRGAGFVALHEVTNTGTVSHTDLGWYGLAALERVALSDGYVNILGFSATLGAIGTDTLAVPFNPTIEPEVFAPENDALTSGTFSPHASLIRIFEGPDAGWYRAQKLFVANSIQLAHLDGSAVAFTVGAYSSRVGVYNVAFATNVPLGAGKWAAGRFYANWAQVDPNGPQDGVVSIGWRGGDENSAGLKIQPNDLDGVAGTKALGWGVYVVVSDPMTGGYRAEAYDGTVAIALASTPGVAAYPDYTDVLGQGVGFMGSSAGQVGRGPGLWLQTSLWMGRSIIPGATPWDDGAFFTEASAGLGRVAYPGLVGESDSYLGSGGFTGWNAPTRLGHPAVLYPATTGASQLADIEQPDLAQFAMPHSGIIDITGMTGHPPTSLLGCIVEILDGASAAQRHRVIAVSATKAALEGPADVVADEVGASVRVEGARWREFHGDVADWAQIGTWWRRAQQDAPVLTIGHRLLDEESGQGLADNEHFYLDVDAGTGSWSGTSALTGTVTGISGTTVTGDGATLFLAEVAVGDYFKITADTASAWTRVKSVVANDELELEDAYPYQASVGAASIADNNTVSVQPDQASLLSHAGLPLGVDARGVGRRNETPTDVLAGDVTAWAKEWQRSYEEPRAPVPNFASIIGRGGTGGGLDTASYRGSLAVDGLTISLEDPSTAGVGASVSASSSMGGCLSFETTGNATVRATFRGVHGISGSFHNLEVRVIAAVPVGADIDITAKLVTSNGEVVALGPTVTIPAGLAPTQAVFDIQSVSLLTAPPDDLRGWDEIAGGRAVCLALSFAMTNADVLFVGKIEVADKTPPLRLLGPQEVVGTHRAAEYRLLTPQKEFIVVGPSQASLLDGDEFGLTELQENSDASERRFVEGRGVGLVSAGGSFFRPTYSQSAFFKRGISGATIVGTHPYFDPLWYLLASNMVVSGGAYDTSRNLVVMPGRTGFVLPLVGLKHGAILTDLAFTLSMLPCYESDSSVANFQIWRGWDGLTGPAGLTDAAYLAQEDGNKAAWDANEGYVVRVWRRHVLDFGEDLPYPQVPPYRATTEANLEFPEDAATPGSYVDVPGSGWAEIIWQGSFDLSAPAESASNAYNRVLRVSSSSGNMTSYFPNEYFEKRIVNLHQDNDVEGPATDQTELERVSKLRVDTRHFEYFVTIEFYIGCREVSAGKYVYDSASEWLDATLVTVGGVSMVGLPQPLRARASTGKPGNYLPDDGPVATRPSPPRVRFRGLRVGTLTDKP